MYWPRVVYVPSPERTFRNLTIIIDAFVRSWLTLLGVHVRMCSIVAALSKSECLKQSLNCLRPVSGSLVDSYVGAGVKSDKTLSLLCMVRRKMPCELVALTVMSHSLVCACANEHGMI